MTINSVTKMWSRSGGTIESENGKSFKIAFSEGWQVSHSADASLPEIMTASGLPVSRDLYPGTFARVTRIGNAIRMGPCFSIVPIDYSGEVGPGGVTDSPLNIRPKIRWQSRTSQAQVDRDWWGRPIMTVNNEAIEGVTMDVVDQTLSIERNFAYFDPQFIHPYLHSVNSDQFPPGKYAPGEGKLMDYTAEEEEANGFIYWKVTALIHFRYPFATTSERAWFFRSKHWGFQERIGSLLTFSGGGVTDPTQEASGHAVVNSSGVITDVVVTNGGIGYTSPPTVAAADGTGATFSASLQDGRVVSVAVTAGGTGYRTRIVQAVDSEKQPVASPVLLKWDGSRELNANNARWLETRLYGALPYNALGLI
jgi:hypothetical protein